MNEKLLSNYNAEWWEFYKTNHLFFDRYFARKYASFVYFEQEENDLVMTVREEFEKAVYDLLLTNDKRYSELYRVNVVPDDENYSITENYFLHETYSGSSNGNGAMTSGQRTDINNSQIGNQKFSTLNKTTPFNTGSELESDSTASESGTRNDIATYTQGQQTTTSSTESTDGHTMTRHGAIGTMTVDDVLEKHVNLWSNISSFYDFIFKEICENYLLVGC